MQWSSKVRLSSELESSAAANQQNTGDVMSISSVLPEPPQSDVPGNAIAFLNKKPISKARKKKKETKKAAKASAGGKEAGKEKKEIGRKNRATALRKTFPDMQNIPESITPSQRKRLISNHFQKATSMVQPTHSGTNEGPKNAGLVSTAQPENRFKAMNSEKQRNRAASLKEQYPSIGEIPSKIGKGTRRKLVAEFNARLTAQAPSVRGPKSSGTAAGNGRPLNELPTRLMPPAPKTGRYSTRQSTRAGQTPVISSENSMPKPQRPASHKMAPLSEERRAEVARNLAAGSNDDPVMID